MPPDDFCRPGRCFPIDGHDFFSRTQPKSDEPSSGQSLFCFFEKTVFRQLEHVISFENTSESSHFDSLPEDNVFSQSRQNAVPAEESATVDASDDRCGSQVCTVFLESNRCFSNRSFQSRDAEPPSMSAKRRLLSSSRTHRYDPSAVNKRSKVSFVKRWKRWMMLK